MILPALALVGVSTVRFVYRPVVGKTYRFEYRDTTEMDGFTSELILPVEFRVLRETPSGFTVEVKSGEGKVRTTGSGFSRRREERLAKARSGKRFTAELAANGDSRKWVTNEIFPHGIGGANVAWSFRGFSPPQGPVRVGQAWSTTESRPIKDGDFTDDLTLVTRYRLDSLRRVSRQDLATILRTGQLSDVQLDQGHRSVLRGQVTGETVVEMSTGLLVSGSLRMDMLMSIDGGRPTKARMRTDVRRL